MKLDLEFWTKHISFYLDGKGFQRKMNQLDAAKAPRAREWRTTRQRLDYRCVAKESKEGTRNVNFMVGISYSKGVVLCEQYFGSITGQKFVDIATSVSNCVHAECKSNGKTDFDGWVPAPEL